MSNFLEMAQFRVTIQAVVRHQRCWNIGFNYHSISWLLGLRLGYSEGSLWGWDIEAVQSSVHSRISVSLFWTFGFGCHDESNFGSNVKLRVCNCYTDEAVRTMARDRPTLTDNI